MKKTLKPQRVNSSKKDLKVEYVFDYSKAKPNRFAERAQRDAAALKKSG